MFILYAESVVIYADILFVINFSLDYLCLFLAARLLNLKAVAWRLVLAAAMGGAYAFLPYVAELAVYISLPLNLGFAGVMCFVSFGKMPIKRFLFAVVTYIAASALMGGLITALYSLFGKSHQGVYAETGAMGFALACFVSALIAFLFGIISKRKIHTKSAEINLYIAGEKISARLLADSGNMVTEPFSSLPVIIISAAALPPPYDNPDRPDFPLKIRAIPFGTASGKGCFLGFRPDKIEIVRLGKKPLPADAYIAVDTFGNGYSGYDGIIPTSIM